MRPRKQKALRPIKTVLSSEDDDEEDEPLSPGGRLFHEPNFNVHILVIIGCKTKTDPEIAKAIAKSNLPRTLLKHPRFTSLPVVDEKDGNMKWIKTEVDLNKHIIIPKLNLDNENYAAEKLLEDYIYNLTKTKLDNSRPMWDLHILDLKTSDAEGVWIFRIHHSLGDGVSLMSLLVACTRQTSNPEALPTIPTRERSQKKLPRNFRNSVFRVWWILILFWNTFVDVLMFIASALLLIKDSATPIKGPPGSENNPRRIVFKMISLDDMKLVKNAMDMTINDVAVGITQAGLSKYLNRVYGIENKKDEGETEKKNNLPKKILLRSILFNNIRPSSGIQALADMMERNTRAKWGNCFGYVLVPFTIGLKDEPLEYVRNAKSTIDRKKHSFEALCSFSIAGLIYNLFGVKAASCFFKKLFISTTMGFSNVVGPLEEIGFYGYPIAYLTATTYGQACELLVGFQSYADKMSLSLSVDESTISNPHQLCDDIIESLQLIKDSVIRNGLC